MVDSTTDAADAALDARADAQVDARTDARPPGQAVADRRTGRMLVIWNPDAGGATDDDRDERQATISRALAAHGLDAELYTSSSEDDASQRVAAALDEGYAAIVAAGGDGTVRSIAFRMLERETSLGILPLGTAMNVARSLGIPLELDAAADVLATGEPRTIDVGSARDRPFLEIASIGLGADVLAGATHLKEGRVAAALGLLRTAVRHRRTRVRLQLDGREVRSRALSLAVANGGFTGRGMELAPGARLGDGRFDILLFEGFGWLGLVVHLARVVLGRKHDERIRRYRARVVRVSSHRRLPVRLDSQDVGTTPVELVTRPRALRVIVPAP